MAFPVITPEDLEGVGVAEPFPTRPKMTAAQLKAAFEETVRTKAIPAINEISEMLNSPEGAAAMMAIDPESLMEVTLQGALNTLKAYTDQKVVDIGAGDMAKMQYDADSRVLGVGGIALFVAGEVTQTVEDGLATLDPESEARAAGGIAPYVEGFYMQLKPLWTGNVNLSGQINIADVGKYAKLVISNTSGIKYPVYRNDAETAFVGGGAASSTQAAMETNATTLTIASNGNSLTVTSLTNIGHTASGNHSQNYVGTIRKVEVEYWGPLAP